MNRRGFLKMLGLGAPAAIVAPTYFFAPSGGWGVSAAGLSVPATGGCLLTPMMISREALRILQRELRFTYAAGQMYDEQFANGSRIRETIELRKPMRFAYDS